MRELNLKWMKSEIRLERLEIFTIMILLFFSFIRLNQLSLESLWLDELYTMRSSNPEFSWSFLIEDVAKNQRHPPFYFILVRIWMSYFGFDESGLRSFSAVISILSFVPLFLLVDKISNRKSAWFSVLLVASSSILFQYGQEGRSYSLTFFLMLMSSYLVVSYEDISKKKWIGFMGVTNGFLILNSFFGIFYIGAYFLFFLFKYFNKRKAIVDILLSILISILIYSPWISCLIDNMGMTGLWIPKPTFYTFLRGWVFLFGEKLSIPLFCLFAVSNLVLIYNIFYGEKKVNQLLPILVIFAVVFGSILVSILIFPIFYDSYCVYFYFPVIIIISVFLGTLKSKTVGVFMFFLVFVLFSYRILNNLYSENYHTQWRQTQTSLSRHFNLPILTHVPEFGIYDYYKEKLNLQLDYKNANSIQDLVERDSIQGWWEMGLHVPVIFFDTLRNPKKDDFLLVLDLDNKNAVSKLFWRKNDITLPKGIPYSEATKLLDIKGGKSWQFDSISKGEYKVVFSGSGKMKNSVYPSFQLLVNGELREKFNTSSFDDLFVGSLLLNSSGRISLSVKGLFDENLGPSNQLKITPPILLKVKNPSF